MNPETQVHFDSLKARSLWMMSYDRETLGNTSIGKLCLSKYLNSAIIQECESFNIAEEVKIPEGRPLEALLADYIGQIIPLFEVYLKNEIRFCKDVEVHQNIAQLYSAVLLEKRYIKESWLAGPPASPQVSIGGANPEGFNQKEIVKKSTFLKKESSEPKHEVPACMYILQDRVITSFIRFYFLLEYFQKSFFPQAMLPNQSDTPFEGSIDSWKGDLRVNYERLTKLIVVLKQTFLSLLKKLDENFGNSGIEKTVSKCTILLNCFFRLNHIYTYYEIHKAFDPNNEEKMLKLMELTKWNEAEAKKTTKKTGALSAIGISKIMGIAGKMRRKSTANQDANASGDHGATGNNPEDQGKRAVYNFIAGSDNDLGTILPHKGSTEESTMSTAPNTGRSQSFEGLDSEESKELVKSKKKYPYDDILERKFNEMMESPEKVMSESEIEDYFEGLKLKIGDVKALKELKRSLTDDSKNQDDTEKSQEEESSEAIAARAQMILKKIATSSYRTKVATMNPVTRKGLELKRKLTGDVSNFPSLNEKKKLKMKIDEKELILINAETYMPEELTYVKVAEDRDENEVLDEEIFDYYTTEEIKKVEEEDSQLKELGLTEEGRKNPNAKNLITFAEYIPLILEEEKSSGRSDYFPKFASFVSLMSKEELKSENSSKEKDDIYSIIERMEKMERLERNDESLWNILRENLMIKFYSKQLGSLTWDTKFVETNDKKELMAGRKTNFKNKAALKTGNFCGRTDRKNKGTSYIQSLQKY